jgi:hypothetical protein
MRPLGEVLAENGDITIRRLRRASDFQKKNGGSIEAALLAVGAISEEVLTSALSHASGLPSIGRQRLLEAEPSVVESLPAEARRRLRALPFDWCGVRLSVAVSDPGNAVLETGLVATTGYDVELYVVPDPVLEACLAVWERRATGAPEPVTPTEPAAASPGPEAVERLARELLTEAIRHEALALELGGDGLSAFARTLHFKVPPMTRRFDVRLLASLLDWFFARAGLEGSFELGDKDGTYKRVLVEQTAAGLSLHFRDVEAAVPEVPCRHTAAEGDVFCPACGAAL